MTDESPTVVMPSTSECSNKRSEHSRLLSTSDLSGNVELNSTVRPEHSSADFSMEPDPDVVPLDLDMDINPELYSSISDDSDADGADLDPTRFNSDSANDIDPGSIPEYGHTDADSEDMIQTLIQVFQAVFQSQTTQTLTQTVTLSMIHSWIPISILTLIRMKKLLWILMAQRLSDMFTPLYDGANITISGAYCAIMEFKRACRDYHFPPFRCCFNYCNYLIYPAGNRLPRS